ncbi:hypothetical protein DL96DRAFT_1592352 [Flagelloscypha sp. PMI_526]|nr:hypothetical protein DL96DRAFT_1592352 [Flagelloscypha sp. PMI_526]
MASHLLANLADVELGAKAFLDTLKHSDTSHGSLLVHNSPLSYLSTPLRLKYFPRGPSPNTLRLFLSSPSIRVSTPDVGPEDLDINQCSPQRFQEPLLLHWLTTQPNPTLDECIARFQIYVNDPTQNTAFISSLKRLAFLQDDHLILRNNLPDDELAANTSAQPLASPILLVKPRDCHRTASSLSDFADSDDSFYLGGTPEDYSFGAVPFDSKDVSSPFAPQKPLRRSQYPLHVTPSVVDRYRAVMNQLMGVCDDRSPSPKPSFAMRRYEPGRMPPYLPSSQLDDYPFIISAPEENSEKENKIQELLSVAERLEDLAKTARLVAFDLTK